LFLTQQLHARVGTLDIRMMHGLAARMPYFSVAFLVFGLALVGFPGTATFAGEDVLLESFLSLHPLSGLCWVLVLALSAITFMGTYMRVFMGPLSHVSQFDTYDLLPKEAFVASVLCGALLVFGFAPGLLFHALGL
jgi:NADH-quinone oxidoreductase subunit M